MTFSTWPRIGVTLALLIAITVGAIGGSTWSAYSSILFGLKVCGIPLLFMATEAERLPERCRVPRHPFLARIAAPWLPGGGRGSLFLLLHLACAFCAIWILRAIWGTPTTRVFQIGVTCLFATVYVLLPCAIVAPLLEKVVGRRRVRCLIPGIMLSCWIVWMFLPRGTHDSGWGLLAQLLSPWALGELITWDTGRYVGHPLSLPILGALGCVAVLGNTPRMWRGVREVVDRSRQRA